MSDRITRGRNAIFGHVARLPDNIPARQVELSVGRPQTLHGNVLQVDHVPNGPTNSAAITTMFPLRLCGGKLLVVVTRERRYDPSRLRVSDDGLPFVVVVDVVVVVVVATELVVDVLCCGVEVANSVEAIHAQ